jgi:hypothetical protein
MPSSGNRTAGSLDFIDMVTGTRRIETAISAAIRTIVAKAGSISSTPSAATPPRDSPTLASYLLALDSTGSGGNQDTAQSEPGDPVI